MKLVKNTRIVQFLNEMFMSASGIDIRKATKNPIQSIYLIFSFAHFRGDDETIRTVGQACQCMLRFKDGIPSKLDGPRAGTILPSLRPSKRIGSVPEPGSYAKVQSAHAGKNLIRNMEFTDDLRVQPR